MIKAKALSPKPSKSVAKFWDGYEFHPFVASIHEVLAAVGFQFFKQSSDAGIYQWRKEISHEYLLEFVLSSARRASTPIGYVSIEAWLTVRSRSVQQIEVALALHECATHKIQSATSKEDSKAILVYVLDQWLKSMQKDAVPGSPHVAQFKSDDMNAWTKISDSSVHLIACVEENARKKEGVIGEIALAPKSSVTGPFVRTTVSRPDEFLAVLYAVEGDRKHALMALDAGLIAATRRNDEVDLCRLGKLKTWLISS